MCEDLPEQVAGLSAQKPILQAVFQRLETWKALVVGHSPKELSREARQGLYGELVFLQKLLHCGLPVAGCLRWWTGPAKAVHDFQHQGQTVEIKTLAASNPPHFHLSNKRRLDDSSLDGLYIGFFSLNDKADSGLALNE